MPCFACSSELLRPTGEASAARSVPLRGRLGARFSSESDVTWPAFDKPPLLCLLRRRGGRARQGWGLTAFLRGNGIARAICVRDFARSVRGKKARCRVNGLRFTRAPRSPISLGSPWEESSLAARGSCGQRRRCHAVVGDGLETSILRPVIL